MVTVVLQLTGVKSWAGAVGREWREIIVAGRVSSELRSWGRWDFQVVVAIVADTWHVPCLALFQVVF